MPKCPRWRVTLVIGSFVTVSRKPCIGRLPDAAESHRDALARELSEVIHRLELEATGLGHLRIGIPSHSRLAQGLGGTPVVVEMDRERVGDRHLWSVLQRSASSGSNGSAMVRPRVPISTDGRILRVRGEARSGVEGTLGAGVRASLTVPCRSRRRGVRRGRRARSTSGAWSARPASQARSLWRACRSTRATRTSRNGGWTPLCARRCCAQPRPAAEAPRSPR